MANNELQKRRERFSEWEETSTTEENNVAKVQLNIVDFLPFFKRVWQVLRSGRPLIRPPVRYNSKLIEHRTLLLSLDFFMISTSKMRIL